MNAIVELEQADKTPENSSTPKPKRHRIQKKKTYELVRVVKPTK